MSAFGGRADIVRRRTFVPLTWRFLQKGLSLTLPALDPIGYLVSAPDKKIKLRRATLCPIQLQEVLLNLIMNAVEAMDSTAEDLRVLTIASMPDTEGVRVTVEDSGIGIDAKKAEQIFEAFFTTKPTGMGMGLAICRSIVAAHDGRLWASPGASGGTVFHVFLPVGVGDASDGQSFERDRLN